MILTAQQEIQSTKQIIYTVNAFTENIYKFQLKIETQTDLSLKITRHKSVQIQQLAQNIFVIIFSSSNEGIYEAQFQCGQEIMKLVFQVKKQLEQQQPKKSKLQIHYKNNKQKVQNESSGSDWSDDSEISEENQEINTNAQEILNSFKDSQQQAQTESQKDRQIKWDGEQVRYELIEQFKQIQKQK